MPAIPDAFPELFRPLSDNELARLVEDDAAIDAMITSITSVESMASLLESLRSSNLREATATLRREEELSRLHAEAAGLQHALRNGTTQHRARVAELSERHAATPAACLQELRARCDAAKKASEGVANALLHRAADADANDAKALLTLLAEYQRRRTEFHTLTATAQALSSQPSH